MPMPDTRRSLETFGLTKDGRQQKVKDTGELAKNSGHSHTIGRAGYEIMQEGPGLAFK